MRHRKGGENQGKDEEDVRLNKADEQFESHENRESQRSKVTGQEGGQNK